MMYITNGSVKTNIDHVVAASLRDSLDGEVSLTLSLDSSYRDYITDSSVIESGDYYFDIAAYDYKTLGDTFTVNVSAEHVSCRLNTSLGVGGLSMQGTPSAILAVILNGSDFTVGTVEDSAVYTVAIHGNTYRKNAIVQLANLCGCEISYSGYKINLVKHRGSKELYELTEDNILVAIDYSRDVVNNTERYTLEIGQLGGLEVGREVNVVYHPYGINGRTARVLAVEYNPYDKFEAVVEVGEYTPDITGEMLGQTNEFNEAKWEFEANDEKLLSRITDAEGNITTLTQTSESLSSRIEDAEGNISYLEQTVNGFEARITNAEGDAAEALASAESLEYRMTTAEGNISTALQTAEKIEWIIASGTSSTNFTLTSRMAELISDNISLRGKTIALTTDSINITSTYFNVATTGAVDCTSLSVTGDKSSINITGNSSDSGIIKAIFSSNPSFNTVHTPAAFSAYFPYGYSFYGGQYADQLDGSTGYTHVSRFSTSEFYVGSASKINPAIKATVYDSGTDYVLIGGQLSVYGYKNRVEQTAHFGDRLMYTFETPSPLYSDIGRGTVGDDGLCYIDLDPIFYECIDNAYEYFVFLQRESGGDLIVSARYADYFVVSGTPGSRFAWMLIAPQRGASATREEELHVPESEPVSEINQENVAADEMTTAVLNEFESQLY